MNKITSEKFYEIWLKHVIDNKNNLEGIWRNSPEFTKAILHGEHCILSKVANGLELKLYSSNYYSIDAILYKDEDLVPNPPSGKFWFRDMRVAFEHENDVKSGLFKEVAHLLIVNADLKVLVSYPDDEEKELSYLHSIINGNRDSKKISDDESFLVIFGYQNGYCWEGYVFKENEWKKLNN